MKYLAWMLVMVGVVAGGWWMMRGKGVERGRGTLRQEVYVWQREWTEDVRAAVREHGGLFGGVVVLAGQIEWGKAADGKVSAKVIRVPVAWGELKGCREVGIAVRIGAYLKGEAYEGAAEEAVEGAVKNMCEAARAAGAVVAEVQIDFDAAESKLEGYAVWVRAAKRGSGGVPVRITALPSWLDQPAFLGLAKECGAYVLQVHSLERPATVEKRVVLCDPAAAKEAVEKAGKLGVPFRVALPTYGYLLIFDKAGKYLGLEAEGAGRVWPEGSQKRWLGADAGELAGLVKGWEADRPAGMEGVIWYRMPVSADRRNWRWATLAAVMEGRRPGARVVVESAASEEAGVRDVVLRNVGEAEARWTMEVEVTWDDATMVASDVIDGFEKLDGGERRLRMRGMSDPDERLAPGESRKIAWVRLDKDTEVRGYVEQTGK